MYCNRMDRAPNHGMEAKIKGTLRAESPFALPQSEHKSEFLEVHLGSPDK